MKGVFQLYKNAQIEAKSSKVQKLPDLFITIN